MTDEDAPDPGVALFMRIEGQREIMVGRAKSMGHVPALVFELARRWQTAADRDALYDPPAG